MPAPTDILGKIGQAIAAEVNSVQELVDNLNEVTGDLTINGNLTVGGQTTTLQTTTLEVEDNIIELNKTDSGAMGAATSGIQVHLGQQPSSFNNLNYSDTSEASFDAHWGATAQGATVQDNPTAYTTGASGTPTIPVTLENGLEAEAILRRRYFLRKDSSYNYDYAILFSQGGSNTRTINGITGSGIFLEDYSDGVSATLSSPDPRADKNQLIGLWNVSGVLLQTEGWSFDWTTELYNGITNLVINSLEFTQKYTPLNPATIIWNNDNNKWEIKQGSDIASVKANFKIASGSALTMNGVALGDYNNFLTGYNYTP